MEKKDFDIEKINSELEQGNYDIAEKLISENYNKKFSLDIIIPDNFTVNIAQKSRKKRKTNMLKVVKVASVFVCISVLGITAYAATQYFRGVENFDFGFIIGEKTAQEEKDNNVDTSKIRKQMEDEKIEKSIENSQDKSNEKWISRKVYNEKSVYHYSNDGINWDKSETAETKITEYVYPSYESALQDKEMPVLFEGYKEKEVVFYEYDNGGDGKIEDSELKVKYNLEQGTFILDLYKNYSNNKDMEQILITDTNKTINQRKKMIDEYEWILSDSKKNGDVITTTVQSKGGYFLVLQFKNMQEQDVSEVLEKINLKALIE